MRLNVRSTNVHNWRCFRDKLPWAIATLIVDNINMAPDPCKLARTIYETVLAYMAMLKMNVFGITYFHKSNKKSFTTHAPF